MGCNLAFRIQAKNKTTNTREENEMIIEHVVIENYRGLLHVDVPVSQFSVIIGENDSGKTSFLYALKAFLEKTKMDDKEDWFNHKIADGDVDINIMITLTFSEAPQELDSKFVRPDGKVKIRGTFQFAKPPKYHAIVQDDPEIAHEMKKEMDHFASDNVIFVPVDRNINEQFAMKKTAMLGKILRAQMKEAIDQQRQKDAMRDAIKIIEQTMAQSIGNAGDRIGYFMREQLNNDKIKLSFDSLKMEPLDGVQISPTLSDGKMENIPLANRGAGTQNNAILALFRYIAESDIKKKFIFLLEEPENSLHPKAQRDLFDVVQQIGEGAQVFVTTHSPVFIDRTEYESNILLTLRNCGGTIARTFKEVSTSEVRNELGVRVSDVLLKGGGNCALLVEGATEEDIMPVFMRAMDVNVLSSGITIVDMKGSDKEKTKTQLKLLECYGIPCVVMLDNDAQECCTELNSLMEKNLIPDLKAVIRLEKGSIEDYYPRDIIMQVMREKYNVTIPKSAVREGSSVKDLRGIFHDNKCGPFVKTRFGRHCANLMKQENIEVPKQIRDIIVQVVEIASRS